MPQVPVKGTCQKVDRNAGSIFLNLKHSEILFFCVDFGFLVSSVFWFCEISAIFFWSGKFLTIFGVLQFLYHTLNILNKEHTGY